MMPSPLRPPARSRHRQTLEPQLRSLGSLAAVLFVCLLAAGCGTKAGATGGGQSPSPSSSARPSTTAVIAITEPTQGEVITGPTVTVTMTLSGATLVPPGTITGVSPGQGHIHISLDGAIVSMTSGLTEDFPVTPGPHILQAEFVANDHLPFYPREIQTVQFTVQ